MPCTPNQLKLSTLSQTSPGFLKRKVFLDRESGKEFVIQSLPFEDIFADSYLSITSDLNGKNFAIQSSSFDVNISGASLSISTDLNRLSHNNLIALLKCLLHLQVLPEAALEEVVEELRSIADFYYDRNPPVSLANTLSSNIKGELKHSQVRDPIVLDS